MLFRFSKLPNSDAFLLLNLLKIFSEEVQSPHLRVGDNRRRVVNTELAQQTSAVLQFLVFFTWLTDLALDSRLLIFCLFFRTLQTLSYLFRVTYALLIRQMLRWSLKHFTAFLLGCIIRWYQQMN